jgi:hypothetical protein
MISSVLLSEYLAEPLIDIYVSVALVIATPVVRVFNGDACIVSRFH